MKHQPDTAERVLFVLWIVFACAAVLPVVGAIAVICWRIASGDTGCPR